MFIEGYGNNLYYIQYQNQFQLKMKLCLVLACVWHSVGLSYGGGSELVFSTI